MKALLRSLLSASALLVMGVWAGGCGSKQDPGLQGPGATSADSAPDTNPEGVPYPTDDIGRLPRKISPPTPGNRIANFKFLGYPNADESQGLQPLSLADYYDPTGNTYALIHIQAAGVWCSACKEETGVIVNLKPDFDKRKVVWLVSMAEGPTPNTPSQQKDLNNWIAQYKSPFTHWLDPSNANLGPFYDRSALPWNANIDAKTMEILTSATGTVATKDYILKDLDDAIAMTKTSAFKAATPP
jgi:hypothetical protein